jgi:hypothetical protein
MKTSTKTVIQDALDIIESCRYTFGTMAFFLAFIDEWAYQQTGLYPPATPLPNTLVPKASKLSHLLAKAMAMEPTSDVLGYMMSMANFEKRGTNYYPTPPAISRLLAELAEGTSTPNTRFYEPCCGSGINAIMWMENYLRSHPDLTQVSIYLEDIDPVMVKCSMLQIVHYLQYQKTAPKQVNIVCIDTITRREKSVAYHFASAIDEDWKIAKAS